jgi:FlaA1/EpsC-like NDP-sugar epimerase
MGWIVACAFCKVQLGQAVWQMDKVLAEDEMQSGIVLVTGATGKVGRNLSASVASKSVAKFGHYVAANEPHGYKMFMVPSNTVMLLKKHWRG